MDMADKMKQSAAADARFDSLVNSLLRLVLLIVMAMVVEVALVAPNAPGGDGIAGKQKADPLLRGVADGYISIRY